MVRETIILPAPPNFSLKATVLSHGWHECSPMSWSEGGRCFQIIEREADSVFRVSVTQGPPRRTGENSLAVSIETAGRDAVSAIQQSIPRLLERLAITLSLHRDLSEFYKLCEQHPALSAAPRIGAGRLIRSASMTENIIKAICGTNVNWTQAVKMINRIGQLGPNLPHFRSLTAWPTPREILRAGEPYLKNVCRLGYRSESILRFCKDVVEGRFDPESLDEMAADPAVTSADLVALLKKVPGIGPSSANYLVGFLGRHDRLSVDTATVAHVRSVHANGREPTLKQIAALYAPYGLWQNLVYWVEHWLTWDTAKGIIDDAKFNGSLAVPAARKTGRGMQTARSRSRAGQSKRETVQPQRRA